MSRFAIVVLLALSLTVPALSACGGSKDYKPSKEEQARRVFLLQANQVCTATDAATADIKPKKLSEVPTAASELIVPYRAQLVTLRKLQAPDMIAPAWNRVLTLGDKQVALFDQISRRAKQRATVREVAGLVKQLNAVTIEMKARSGALGLPNCAG